MSNGCFCPQESRWPRSFLATHRPARCLYILCLVVSFASMLLIAYSTSYGNSRAKDSEHVHSDIGLTLQQTGNILKEKVTSSVSRDNSVAPSISSKSDIIKSSIFSTDFKAPTFYNCSLIHTDSELLSMKPPKYNRRFKNPCWYEDLTTSDVYIKNKFTAYYRNVKSVFMDLIDLWKKRLQEEAFPKRLRCLPYFFIAGQPKCGSTDLYQKLSSHPDVVTPPIKESHWWGKNRYGWRSNYTTSLPFNDYIDLYDKVATYIDHVHDPNVEKYDYHQLITGDASVSTLWDNDEWWRLKENCGLTEPKYTNADYVYHFLPHAKIIVILRDPIDRLWSDYLYFQKSSKSQEDFHKNVLIAINYHNNCTARNTLESCVYNRSLANLVRVRLRIGIYFTYLDNWLNVYPRDQFLILRLEDYATKNRYVMKKVFRFLKLRDLTKAESDYILGQPVANVRKKGDRKLGKMSAKSRKVLEEFYEPYNKRLALLLNDNRFMWKDQKPAPSATPDSSADNRLRRSSKNRQRIMKTLRKLNCDSNKNKSP